ncbi:MAG TPA: CoA transferase [Dongiaceae bacterium]|jgi:CoA:oxalate CoA-transferase|nr:CoA transferase [Dongiaceae bacterium]
MSRPLTGITVLDLTRVLAGPFCTLQLRNMGARVIKVELPHGGDDARTYGPNIQGKSGYFASLNYGKESIALDLHEEADREIFERLLARADVLVENFRPGAMKRLGYDWESLLAKHPRLVYAAISGFGQDGPYAARPAYDMIIQGMSGLMNLTGYPDSEPARVGISISDLGAGLFGAFAIASALFAREKSGHGRFIDIAMLDCQIALLENALARYYGTGQAPQREGVHHPSIAPFGAYPTADRQIVLACGNDDLFNRLCVALDRPALQADERFTSNVGRVEHRGELTASITAALAAHPAEIWLRRFVKAGIPAGPVNDIADVAADPHVAQRRLLLPIADPDLSGLRVAGNPIHLSGDIPDEALPAPPTLNQHCKKLLREIDWE